MTTKEKAKHVISMFSMIQNRAESGIENAKETVAKFAAEIQTDNAAYHFEWAHGSMKAAAKGAVCKQVQKMLLNGATIIDMYNEVASRVMHTAQYPEFSTSPTSNLMSQFMASAYAEWAETLQNAIDYLERQGIAATESTTEEA